MVYDITQATVSFTMDFYPFSLSYTDLRESTRTLTDGGKCADNWKFAPEDSACSLDQLDQHYQQSDSPMEGLCFRKKASTIENVILALGAKVFCF